MALGPVVTGTGLAKDKVVRTEELPEGTGPDAVHGTRLEVHEDGTGDVASTGSLVEVDVDAFELQVRVSVVGSCGDMVVE